MRDTLRLDAVATALISRDVVLLDRAAMALPTPCEGWTVADLVRHINEEHEDVAQRILGPLDQETGEDVREAFALIAARWLVACDRAGNEVLVPKVERMVHTDRVLSIHFVDMLVHRWDIAQALGTTPHVPAALTDAALPIARRITEPDSPLVGAGGVYGPRVADTEHRGPLDRVVGLLGRDPDWRTTHDVAASAAHDA